MDELSVETAGGVIIPPLILEESDFNGAAQGEHGNSRMKALSRSHQVE